MPPIKKRIVPWLANISLSAAVFFVVLLLIEFSLKILTPFPSAFLYTQQIFQPDPELGYAQVPHVDIAMKQPEFTIQFTTNAYGFRDKEYSPDEIAKKNFVILGVGDSFSLGFGVEEKDSYLTLVEQELQKRGKDLEVINASVGGYGTIQEAKTVEKFAPLFNPDIVLLSYHSANDMSDDYEFVNNNKWFFTASADSKSFYDTARKYYLKIFPFTYQYLRNNSLAVKINAFFNRITNERTSPLIGLKQFYSTYDEEMEKHWLRTSGAIKKLNDSLKKKNIAFFLVIIPSLPEIHSLAQENLISSFGLRKDDMDFRKVNTLLRDFAAKNGIPVIDLMPALEKENKENYYTFDEHLNVRGHRLASEVISNILWNQIHNGK